MTRVKLCGIMTAAEAAWINKLEPEIAGMVFAPHHRRTVTREQAHLIRNTVSRSIPLAGVFADAPISEINEIADEGLIQFAQLQGHEDNTYIRDLRTETGLIIIQKFRVQSDTEMLAAERSDADLVLLDGGFGEGKPFNWQKLRYFTRPFFLAGGLDPARVKNTVALYEPYGVDVSEGIETDGQKDFEKMQAFMRAVRG